MPSKMVWLTLVAPTTTKEMDSREKDCMKAKSYLIKNGHWYYPPNSYQAPTK